MKSKILQKGFTLVELLIVIALISILSVAVLATINPIEQANKARDAKFKNDAAEVLSAYERYYASKNAYPWNDVGTTVVSGTQLIIGSTETRFGIISGADTDGVLITASELKSSFRNKAPFETDATAKVEDRMYTYFDGNSSSYVCYIPKAGVNWMLKILNV
jgi:prepilin-type N-terminal cleavage/methylation domain-containing protein